MARHLYIHKDKNMPITSITYKQFNIPQMPTVEKNELPELISKFCKTFTLPDEKTNHANFNEKIAKKIAAHKTQSVKPVLTMLQKATNERDITAGLFLLNRIIDEGTPNIENTYPIISQFNYSNSHNVQVMLAGIYRKTLVPDGFGPLLTMFINNSKNPTQIPFDPNEEVGGAILEYIKNKSATETYKNLQ